MIKLYMGGSPCTHWSIAQTKNRETEPSGMGWELFKNYLIGLEKYNPNYFLYENNKSMAPAIREQITKELGVEPILINSALVSAQNRQRLYWTNIPNVVQPEDKGILLKDILESGIARREKSYTLDANYFRSAGTYNPKSQHSYSRHMVAEPLLFGCNGEGKAHRLDANYWKGSLPENTLVKHRRSLVAEPIRIDTIESNAKNTDFDSQQYRVYSPDGKSVTLCGNGGGVGVKTGLYAVSVNTTIDGKAQCLRATYYKDGIRNMVGNNIDRKTCVAIPVSETIMVSEPRIVWRDNGLYATTEINNEIKEYPVYEVRDGLITIKDNQYPIKLPDGFYIIRKLTVTECKRLQTVPDSYIFPVSNSQAYKMLGNGWTVDVIAHILSFIPNITTEPIEVFGMYDGMSCGHIALDKLGANVVRYYATEIDKYAIQTTMANYPDTIQLGDAFQVQKSDWNLSIYS